MKKLNHLTTAALSIFGSICPTLPMVSLSSCTIHSDPEPEPEGIYVPIDQHQSDYCYASLNFTSDNPIQKDTLYWEKCVVGVQVESGFKKCFLWTGQRNIDGHFLKPQNGFKVHLNGKEIPSHIDPDDEFMIVAELGRDLTTNDVVEAWISYSTQWDYSTWGLPAMFFDVSPLKPQ